MGSVPVFHAQKSTTHLPTNPVFVLTEKHLHFPEITAKYKCKWQLQHLIISQVYYLFYIRISHSSAALALKSGELL